jgi:hypothetical protein
MGLAPVASRCIAQRIGRPQSIMRKSAQVWPGGSWVYRGGAIAQRKGPVKDEEKPGPRKEKTRNLPVPLGKNLISDADVRSSYRQ